jgi:hypothetical protein
MGYTIMDGLIMKKYYFKRFMIIAGIIAIFGIILLFITLAFMPKKEIIIANENDLQLFNGETYEEISDILQLNNTNELRIIFNSDEAIFGDEISINIESKHNDFIFNLNLTALNNTIISGIGFETPYKVDIDLDNYHNVDCILSVNTYNNDININDIALKVTTTEISNLNLFFCCFSQILILVSFVLFLVIIINYVITRRKEKQKISDYDTWKPQVDAKISERVSSLKDELIEDDIDKIKSRNKKKKMYKICGTCETVLESDWDECPFCGTPVQKDK